MSDLLLTPGNAIRITNQLAQMRGAAMKVGQLLSMEASDLLPPELADILGHLRADAHHMPPSQLKKVLSDNWGRDFLRRFVSFDIRPIAAASIGQVHRAKTRDGRDLAIKVQYPGVRQSIDSDVRNVASLLRLSGLVPAGLDIAPLLEEAKKQLHEEADYEREGRALASFGALLEAATEFHVPRLHADLTTPSILCMDFVDGLAMESLTEAAQPVRDRVATLLVGLLLREFFEFGVMQTDPNFANYRYDPDSGRLILLDFGATREFPPEMVTQYRELLRAGLLGDRAAVRTAVMNLGFLGEALQSRHETALLDMADLVFGALRSPGPFDFSTSDLAARLRDAGTTILKDRAIWTIPPADALYLQRKIGGTFLLATHLRARIDLDTLIFRYL